MFLTSHQLVTTVVYRICLCMRASSPFRLPVGMMLNVELRMDSPHSEETPARTESGQCFVGWTQRLNFEAGRGLAEANLGSDRALRGGEVLNSCSLTACPEPGCRSLRVELTGFSKYGPRSLP